MEADSDPKALRRRCLLAMNQRLHAQMNALVQDVQAHKLPNDVLAADASRSELGWWFGLGFLASGFAAGIATRKFSLVVRLPATMM